MSTMQEVAKKAGVSKATVSRVLSGKGYVSENTRHAVFKAIEEAGYRPNLLARNLATQTSQCIGLVMTNTLYQGNYFNELLSQAAKKLEDNGRQLILADGKHSAEEEQQAIQFLLDLRCDAIIIYPRFLSVEAMETIIEQHKQPIMVVNRTLRNHRSHCICCDHKGASRRATQYLIDQGHRQIAFITGSLDSPTAAERLSGYQQALNENSIAVDNNLITKGKWTAACGASATASLLAEKRSFTAVLASNDEMAMGAIKALHNAGLAVPAGVSVMGFDDIPAAPWLIPALSSVKDPVTEMITQVIDRIIAMLDGGYLEGETVFSSTLSLRDSVAAAPVLPTERGK